ncbi:hypothetical protein BD770DRAFT_473885 [Pilaira anomala]|nr:hypothetical protein BD770DRAFT_473885 [Pilaira anomala]
MRSHSILIALLFLLVQQCVGFDIKSLLFGEETIADAEPSVAFGTPISTDATSNRAVIECKDYICSDTADCVKSAIDCPCPLPTDKKCLIGDWYICINGQESCDSL